MHKLLAWIMRQFKRLVAATILLACLSLTVFILANSYEIAFSHDLPVIDAYAPVDLNPLKDSLGKQSLGDMTSSNRFGDFGRLETMKISKPITKLTLVPALKDKDKWLARANAGHFLILSPPKNGGLGDLAIYIRQSWRTINQPQQLANDGNIFIDTDHHWRYTYKIDQIINLAPDSQYIFSSSKTSQLLIYLVSADDHQITLIKASQVTLLNVE